MLPKTAVKWERIAQVKFSFITFVRNCPVDSLFMQKNKSAPKLVCIISNRKKPFYDKIKTHNAGGKVYL